MGGSRGASKQKPQSSSVARNRGARRRCGACGVAFYDLGQAEVACPKCGTPYVATALLTSGGRPPRRNRTWTRRPAATEEGAAIEAPVKEAPLLDPDDDEDGEPAEEVVADEEVEAAADVETPDEPGKG